MKPFLILLGLSLSFLGHASEEIALCKVKVQYSEEGGKLGILLGYIPSSSATLDLYGPIDKDIKCRKGNIQKVKSYPIRVSSILSAGAFAGLIGHSLLTFSVHHWEGAKVEDVLGRYVGADLGGAFVLGGEGFGFANVSNGVILTAGAGGGGLEVDLSLATFRIYDEASDSAHARNRSYQIVMRKHH